MIYLSRASSSVAGREASWGGRASTCSHPASQAQAHSHDWDHVQMSHMSMRSFADASCGRDCGQTQACTAISLVLVHYPGRRVGLQKKKVLYVRNASKACFFAYLFALKLVKNLHISTTGAKHQATVSFLGQQNTPLLPTRWGKLTAWETTIYFQLPSESHHPGHLG